MRAAVLGSPIAHSLSPALHRAAYSALDLDWSYDAVETVPAALPAWLESLGGEWAGLSLTMPLKQTVLPLLTSRSALVEVTGAANTVVLRDGRREGHNTDVHGIVAALREAGVVEVGRSVVLGGGATAASALAALAQLGDRSPTVAVRDRGRAGPLLACADRLGGTVRLVDLDDRVLEGAGVVVSTLPAGALDALAPALVLPGHPGVLLDVVYDPWPTPLAARWAASGGAVVPGALMLLHQAAAQVDLMTGRPAPLGAMRAALPPLVRSALKA